VIARKYLPLGKREDLEVTASLAVKLPPSRLALWRDKAPGHVALPRGEHAPGEAEISAQEPIMVARFHGQAVLQRRVLDGTSAEIDRASAGIRAGGCGGAKPGTSTWVKRLDLSAAGSWGNLVLDAGRTDNMPLRGNDPFPQNPGPFFNLKKRDSKRQMTSKAVTANRCVFSYFTIHLFLLQFMAHGLHAYFSMYVSKEWHFSGYLLYVALIYLFAAYSLALLQKRQFVTCILQLISLLLLVGIMLYPFDSINHVSLLPFLVALQPIILFSDLHSGFFDAPGTLWGIVFILILIVPIIIVLMVHPILEKIIIYFVTALLFAALQLKIRDGDNAAGKVIASQQM
jgi:hypothetical protein